MALLFVDGFDSYPTGNTAPSPALVAAGWNGGTLTAGTFSNSNTIAATRTSVLGNEITFGSNLQPAKLHSNTSAGYAGFGYRTASSVGGALLIAFREAGSTHIQFQITATGQVAAMNNATTISTSPEQLFGAAFNNVMRYVVVSVNISDTVGSYKLIVDDTTALAQTGVDTRTGGTGVINLITLRQSTNTFYDDFYLGDNTGPAPYNANLGNCTVQVLRPNASVSAGWTPSTGTNNSALVSDTSISVATYVEASVSGLQDRYGLSDMSGNPTNIWAVVPQIYADRMLAPERLIQDTLHSATETTVGTTVSPLLSVKSFTQTIYTQNPNGAVSWDVSAVNALEVGIRTIT